MIGLSLIYPLISYLVGDYQNNYLKTIEFLINKFLNLISILKGKIMI